MKDSLYAIYLRKSREDVELEKYEEGETLARHEKILKDLAEKRNLKIGKIYREVVSGETISEREEMRKLLKDVEEEKWRGILVVEIERLARGDTSDQGRVLKAFKYSHTKIITPVKVYDPDNEFDEEYFEFGLFMSRREYKMINRRLQRGREISCQEGKYVGSIAPFGYSRVKLKGMKGYSLEINKEEAIVVKEIFRLYILENTTLEEVVKNINNMKLKPRIAEEWTVSSIKDIILNPVYIGKVAWNRRKQNKRTKNGDVVVSRPRNCNYQIYDGLHEPIIDIKTWNIAQEKRKQYSVKIQRSNSIQNPLAGLIFCERCGRLMQRRPYKKSGKLETLICINNKCDNVSSKLYIVENKIVEALKIWLENYEVGHDYLKELKSNNIFTDKNMKDTFKIKDIIDLYYKLENIEYKNALLKSVISKVTYLKTKKAIKSDSDPTNFELHIYPKIPYLN